MKKDVVSQTCERITKIINEESAKEKGIGVRLENIPDDCKSSNLKLKLHILHKGFVSSQIISDCLSSDNILRIHETVENFCKTNLVKIY